MINPVLVEVTRGELVESRHHGAVAVIRGDGSPVLSIGDTARPVFARSAIKLIQALPLVETGAADRFGFGEPEIALACGSHIGSDRHVAVARGMIERMGMDETCLACGAAAPLGAKAQSQLAATGRKPTAFHHCCSGKHAGMLAASCALGQPTAARAYASPDHPVQRYVRSVIEDLTGVAIPSQAAGTDGCAVPTWALPLDALARAFAVIAARDEVSADRRAAFARILKSCWAQPDLVAGPGRAETVIMTALPGAIYLKSGAEGVYCGALPAMGLGFALKIDDGAHRAAAAAVMPLVEQLIPQAAGLVRRSVLRTGAGAEVGTIRTSGVYERALDGMGA